MQSGGRQAEAPGHGPRVLVVGGGIAGAGGGAEALPARPSHTFGFWRPRPAGGRIRSRSTASVTAFPGTPSRSPAGASGALLLARPTSRVRRPGTLMWSLERMLAPPRNYRSSLLPETQLPAVSGVGRCGGGEPVTTQWPWF